MLIVTAVDKSNLSDISDYDVWIGINQHCIWRGMVTGHVRANGAQALLRKIADAMDNRPQEEQHESPAIKFFTDYLGIGKSRTVPGFEQREGTKLRARNRKG